MTSKPHFVCVIWVDDYWPVPDQLTRGYHIGFDNTGRGWWLSHIGGSWKRAEWMDHPEQQGEE